MGLVCFSPAGIHLPVRLKQLKQVTIMAIILSIYSAVLALGVWQQNQNDQKQQPVNRRHNPC